MTEAESAYWKDLQERDAGLRQFLALRSLSESDLRELCKYLSGIRFILGNLSKSVSFAATLLAKQYLAERFDFGEFDAAAKPQGARGPDIHIQTGKFRCSYLGTGRLCVSGGDRLSVLLRH